MVIHGSPLRSFDVIALICDKRTNNISHVNHNNDQFDLIGMTN